MKKFLESLIFKSAPEDIGEVYYEWSYPEFQKYDRSRTWYIVAGLVALALLVYSIIVVNFLLALIDLLVVLLLALEHFQTPHEVPVKVAEWGVLVGSNFIPYDSIDCFWLAYYPPQVKKLYLDLTGKKNPVSLPLMDTNPLELREILEQFMEEDLYRDNESRIETWARKLKL
jgi:hypothetical protein